MCLFVGLGLKSALNYLTWIFHLCSFQLDLSNSVLSHMYNVCHFDTDFSYDKTIVEKLEKLRRSLGIKHNLMFYTFV